MPEKPGAGSAELFGVYYPEDHIVAVLADAERAAAVQRDLQAAGWPASAIMVYSGQSVLAAYERQEEERGLLDKIGRALSSDERLFSEQYREAAAAGRAFVVAHVSAPDQIERAQVLLASHDASGVRYYDRWTVRSLPTSNRGLAGEQPERA